jgi:hypothetical protein
VITSSGPGNTDLTEKRANGTAQGPPIQCQSTTAQLQTSERVSNVKVLRTHLRWKLSTPNTPDDVLSRRTHGNEGSRHGASAFVDQEQRCRGTLAAGQRSVPKVPATQRQICTQHAALGVVSFPQKWLDDKAIAVQQPRPSLMHYRQCT